jgi:hypothetical protein
MGVGTGAYTGIVDIGCSTAGGAGGGGSAKSHALGTIAAGMIHVAAHTTPWPWSALLIVFHSKSMYCEI